MKNSLDRFIRDESGQSLMEIIVGLSIGAILIGTASFGIAFMLRSTSTNQNLSNGSQLTQGLINNIQSFAGSSWQNIYSLDKGSANQYFLVASGTSYLAVAGQEGVPSNNITNGLVGKWGFDEVTGTIAYDSTGSNNKGTLTNSPTRATSTCKIANCLSFNATSSNYVNVPSTSTLNFTTNGVFSISVWVNPDTLASSWRRGIIVQENYLTSGYRLGFYNGGQPMFWTTQSGGTLQLNSSQNLIANLWSHLVVTYDNQQAYIYLNGIQTGSATGTYIAGSNAIRLGLAVSEYFSGLLDDARYYNRALSSDEVQQLYNSQAFTRYFYVENVCRTNDSSADISTTTSPCPGGTADDPLTQKVTVFTNWLVGANTDQVSLSRYITRWGNFAIRQTDWSGSSGQDGPLTAPNSSYSSSSNITGTSTYGSIQLNNLSQQ